MAFKDLFFKNDDGPQIPTSLSNMAKKHTAVGLGENEIVYEEFDTTGLDLESIVPVSAIYTKEGIGDLTKSIFKVDEIRSTMPPSLPTDVRKQTALGMISVFGLDVAGLIADADLRISTLKSAQATFNENTCDSLATDESKILELEAQIDALKQGINTTKKNQELQNAAIDTEVNKINDIVKFIG